MGSLRKAEAREETINQVKVAAHVLLNREKRWKLLKHVKCFVITVDRTRHTPLRVFGIDRGGESR